MRRGQSLSQYVDRISRRREPRFSTAEAGSLLLSVLVAQVRHCKRERASVRMTLHFTTTDR